MKGKIARLFKDTEGRKEEGGREREIVREERWEGGREEVKQQGGMEGVRKRERGR